MIKKAFRDRLFLVTTFPIALIAFWFVQLTFWGGGFLPFMAILLLALLTAAEPFAAFEIRRTNQIMNSEIVQPERPWYTSVFWSWDGAKQRLSSSKAWFVIAYIFAAIFFSSIGVAILVLFWASLAVLVFALGLIASPHWSWVFSINDSDVSGKFSFFLDSEKFRVTFLGFQSSDVSIPDQLTWNYTSGWTIAMCILFILLNIFLIPVLAKHLKDVVANLLGTDAAVDSFAAKLNLWLATRKNN